ncbi:MAG TPA: glycosyl hydrolase family 28-related protein [Opitutaceae bacterium]|nr:glycosyl hydrolase family 28-related protein [Opitutaceae bacterium]
MRFPGKLLTVLSLAFASAALLRAEPTAVGAEQPWHTFEAETMRTNGVVLGPKYEPYLVETESSGQRCVRLVRAKDFVEFNATDAANALVLRFSLPDAAAGGGTSSELRLLVNGRAVQTLSLSSRYAWLYGKYPFTNTPADGKPRNFYDEASIRDLRIQSGDTIRLEFTGSGSPCIIDLVDLENVPPPLSRPAHSVSITDFATGSHASNDSTEPLRKAIASLQPKGGIVWIPAGEYRITGDIVVPSNVTLQGAGLWHTRFVGDEVVYGDASRRVRFKLSGTNIHLADFAILGKLNYRNDTEPNDGIVGAGCAHSSIRRIWVEHTKIGAWIYNGTRLTIEGCRFRNTLADGVNLCVGTNHSVVENCTARGTGDDCFAIWPAPGDQGHAETAKPGHNVIRRCTGQLTSLANGGALYGGESNRIEDCLFTDIGTGCGILISTTFPTSDSAQKIDNNFSGTTMVENCQLLRCGGFDHTWSYRGSIQICLDRKNISGLVLKNLDVAQSLSDGITLIAPGAAKGQGTLSDCRFEYVTARDSGIGTTLNRAFFIRSDVAGSIVLENSELNPTQNDSTQFSVAGALASRQTLAPKSL